VDSQRGEMMPNHIAILSSLLAGLAATLGTIVIHGFAVHTIIMTLRRNLQRGVLGPRIWVNMTFIMGATLIALAGHLMEITLLGVRAGYMWCGRRYQRGHLFIGWQLHDCGFRHRIAAAMEAAGTI
jgi:hypothetical protein